MKSKVSGTFAAPWLLAAAAVSACSGVPEPAAGQDLEYNRAVHAAQLARPARLTSSEDSSSDAFVFFGQVWERNADRTEP